MNVIRLNKNLPCYNVIDKATSFMSKNIETSIIDYVSYIRIRFKLNSLSYHKALEKNRR